MNRRAYELDDSQSTDDAFGEDVDYSDDDSLLRSSGGDSSPINLNRHHKADGFGRLDDFLGYGLGDDDEELETVSLEEITALLGSDLPELTYESGVEEVS